MLSEPVNIEVDSEETGEKYTIILNSCEISPLSIEFECSLSSAEDLAQELQIVMKDGSIYDDFDHTGGADNDFGLIFGKPLNLSEIDYIQVGDVQIKNYFE